MNPQITCKVPFSLMCKAGGTCILSLTVLTFVNLVSAHVSSAPQLTSGKLQFVYGVVSGNGESYKRLSMVPQDNVDIIFGCFHEECQIPDGIPGVYKIFIPHTTWTSGRNRLLLEVENIEHSEYKKYDYVGFLDEDFQPTIRVPNNGPDAKLHVDILVEKCDSNASLARRPWTYLECLSAQYLPPVATVRACAWSANGFGKEVFSSGYMDGAFVLFHKDAIPYVLPYCTVFDAKTWWASQAILLRRLECMLGFVLQYDWIFKDEGASGNAHATYPRNEDPWELAASLVPIILPPDMAEMPIRVRAEDNNVFFNPVIPMKSNWIEAIPDGCNKWDMMKVEHVGYQQRP